MGSFAARGIGSDFLAGAYAFVIGGLMGGLLALGGFYLLLIPAAFAIAGAGAGAIALTVIALAGELAAMGQIAVAVSGTVGALRTVARSGFYRRGLWAGAVGCWSGYALRESVTFSNVRDLFVVSVLLFFLVLPLANAVWDWLSWIASRRLGRHLLRTLDDERGPWARAWAVAWHGLADLAIAVGLLLAMAWALAFGFALYDEIATWKEAKSAFPELAAMVTRAAAEPFGPGFWLTAMLVTTLFPTLLHGLVLLASPLGLVFLPGKKRRDLAEMLELYEAANEGEQAAIRHEVAVWVTRGQLLAWLGGGLRGTYALLRLLALIAWLASATLVPGVSNFATLVGAAAHAGIATAQGPGNAHGGGEAR